MLSSGPRRGRAGRLRSRSVSSFAEEVAHQTWPGQVRSVSALPGGITNSNYRVELDDSQVVVLRVPGRDTALLGIDRSVEVLANRLAAEAGVAPAVLAVIAEHGCQVTRFVAARAIPADELAEEPMLAKVVSALKRVHAAGRVGSAFHHFEVIDGYHRQASARGVSEPFDFATAWEVVQRFAEARPFRPSVLGHNDLLNANFLYDGSVWILDWEYAGMADPLFDLANLSANNQFSPQACERLLGHYFGEVSEAALGTLGLMQLVSELREAMWGVVQLAISELPVDFEDYATEHGERFFRLLGDIDLDAQLRSAASWR
jgi:thiamine kinase-like enzyme